MTILGRARVGCLRCRTRPYCVHAVLARTVQRTVADALVERYEQRGSPALEGAAVENVGHEALEIIVSSLHATGTSVGGATIGAAAIASHVVAVAG